MLLTRESSELQTGLKGNHARGTVAAEPDSEQARWRGGRIRQRAETGLRRGLPRNADLHYAWQSEIRMVEDIEKLTLKPQLYMFG